MKNITFQIFVLISIVTIDSHGQNTNALESMIKAEHQFAALSKESNTRDAFLAYLTDSTVLFEKGVPVKGKRSWISRKPDSTLLFWWPAFVGISLAGDMGFSVGPWQWSPDKKGSKPVAFGYYATVWQKNKNGYWKMAADIGVSFSEMPSDKTDIKISPTHQHRKSKQRLSDLLDVDAKYTAEINNKKASFSSSYFTNDGMILRDGAWPYEGTLSFKEIKERDDIYNFKRTGGSWASSRDLGYVYGTVVREKPENDSTKKENRCYLRVWKKENEKDWKIVLDVIGGN